MNKNVFTFIGCDCEYEDAKIVLFGETAKQIAKIVLDYYS